MTSNDFEMNSRQKRRPPSRIFSNGAQFELFSKQKTVAAIASYRIKRRAHREKIILLFEYTTKIVISFWLILRKFRTSRARKKTAAEVDE